MINRGNNQGFVVISGGCVLKRCLAIDNSSSTVLFYS
ncbi:hypothetical protein [Prevotella aurantiaca]